MKLAYLRYYILRESNLLGWLYHYCVSKGIKAAIKCAYNFQRKHFNFFTPFVKHMRLTNVC